MSIFAEMCDLRRVSAKAWWKQIERLEEYFLTHGIQNDTQKKAILLCALGSQSYKLIRHLTTPHTPADKTYEQVKSLIGNHLNPNHNIVAERYAFNSRVREPSESVIGYISALRSLIKHCDYLEGDWDEILRDRFVCGINDVEVQSQLIHEGATLTLTTALHLSMSMESQDNREPRTDDREPKTMESCTSSNHRNKLAEFTGYDSRSSGYDSRSSGGYDSRSTTLNSAPLSSYNDNRDGSSVYTKYSQVAQGCCFRCGSRHNPNSCTFIDYMCFLCKRKGHSILKCKNNQSSDEEQRILPTPTVTKTQHENNNESNESTCSRCAHASRKDENSASEQTCVLCKNDDRPRDKYPRVQADKCPRVQADKCPRVQADKCPRVQADKHQIATSRPDMRTLPRENKTDTQSTKTLPLPKHAQMNGKSPPECFHCGYACAGEPKRCPFSEDFVYSDSEELSPRAVGPSVVRVHPKHKKRTPNSSKGGSRSRSKREAPKCEKVRSQVVGEDDCIRCGRTHHPEECPFKHHKKYLSRGASRGVH